jgi:DNA-binding NtrC family response regulator
VLVVDRDNATCELLDEVLSTEGLHVTCCTTPTDAPRLAQEKRPELVLFGVTELTNADRRVIHELQALAARLPIVLMTTAPDGWRWVRDMELAGYLAKPFDIDAPLEIIRRVLEVSNR